MSNEPFRLTCPFEGAVMVAAVSPSLPKVTVTGTLDDGTPYPESTWNLTISTPTRLEIVHPKGRNTLRINRETGKVLVGAMKPYSERAGTFESL